MATFNAAAALAAAPIYRSGGRGERATAIGTYPLTVAPVANDIYNMCRVPAGATVIDGWLIASDIDTGTGVFAVSIGWAANGVEAVNAAGFLASNVLNGTAGVHVGSVAGIRIPFQGVLITTGPQTFTRETIITVTNLVAANVFTAGRMNLYVDYVCL